MKPILPAILLGITLILGNQTPARADNNQTGWMQNAPGMPKYVDKPISTRNNDSAITIMAVVGGIVIVLAAFTFFFRETLALSGPRPRKPWDL